MKDPTGIRGGLGSAPQGLGGWRMRRTVEIGLENVSNLKRFPTHRKRVIMSSLVSLSRQKPRRLSPW